MVTTVKEDDIPNDGHIPPSSMVTVNHRRKASNYLPESNNEIMYCGKIIYIKLYVLWYLGLIAKYETHIQYM